MASVRLFQAAQLLTKSQYSLTRFSPTGKNKNEEKFSKREKIIFMFYGNAKEKKTHIAPIEVQRAACQSQTHMQQRLINGRDVIMNIYASCKSVREIGRMREPY